MSAPPSMSPQKSEPTAPLRESEEQFRLLVSSVAEFAVFTTDPDGLVISWNAGAARITGYDASEVLGKPSSIFLPAEDAATSRPRRAMQAAVRDGRHEEEAWRVRRDGSRFFAHVVTVALRDSSGSLSGFGIVTHDVSERRESDAGAARLAAIVESSQDAIIGKNLDDTIVAWNQGAERLYGYARAEAVGQHAMMLVPADAVAEYRAMMDRVIRGESFSGVEATRLRKGGSRVEVSLSASPVKDSAGVIVGASIIARDITERKRGEEAIRQSEARLRAVLETAVDAVITIDERGRIQSVNPATQQLFGYAAQELLGQNVNMLMPSPYHEEHDGYLARYMKTGEKRIIGIGREVQARRKDGTAFPIDLAVSEVEPGRLFTGIIRDISERKTSEARLREADRMASIGTLAAGLGHDMNNVLLPVRAHLNVLKRGSDIDRRSHQGHVEKIQQGVAYLQQLADGLHFLAMDPEKDDDAGGSTNLHAWWMQTGALLRKAVPKHVKVTTSFRKDLPEVAIAAHALTQAMLNLIVNAGEAIPGNRKRRQGYVRLFADLEADGSSVRLSVADNGSGMTEEVKRRAFDMFFTTKPRGLGTGLGLAMVRKAVDRAGGSIEIESTLGKGTTISLILPAAGDAAGRGELAAAVQLRDGRAASLIRNLLEASGVKSGSDVARESADVWFLDPLPEHLADAKSWRAMHPEGKLVLFGPPDGASRTAWFALEPVIIDEPKDLTAVREAIGLVTADS